MSIHVLASLKTALRARLLASPAISTLIGAAIHDMPQKTANPPYLAFGNAVIRDQSSTLGSGAVIDFEIQAVAHERGTTRGLALMAALEAALDDPLPALDGHQLIALERAETRVQHDADKNLVRATLRLRAYTESP